jgi:hypothetical protein
MTAFFFHDTVAAATCTGTGQVPVPVPFLFCFFRPPNMRLAGKPAPSPSTGGVLQARLKAEVQNKHTFSCKNI